MMLINSLGLGTLKFDNVVSILLSEEVYRKSTVKASSSGSALNDEDEELLKEGKTMGGQNLWENPSQQSYMWYDRIMGRKNTLRRIVGHKKRRRSKATTRRTKLL